MVARQAASGVTFVFKAEDHSYWLGERRLPNISAIIETLEPYPEHLADIIERKSHLGSAAHYAAALDDAGLLDESTLDVRVVPYLAAWRKFRADSGFKPIHIEQPAYSPVYGYAGTIDRVGELDGLIVVELKCTSEIRAVTAIQTAGQALLVSHGLYGDEPMQRCAVQLKPNGDYRFKLYSDRADRKVFLGALQVYQWRQARVRIET